MATRRSIQIGAFNGLKEGPMSPVRSSPELWSSTVLGAGRRAIDEQAALCNNLLAGFQITFDLDEVAIGEAGLDLAQFDRLVLMRDPDPNLIALVDQCLLWRANRRMVAGGIDRDIGEHFRL